VGYGRIIPLWMIDLPKLGNLNVHASLLPKYRGAAPIQWAIASGETVTGITTMRIDAGLDTGPILLQREHAIAALDTSETVTPVLAAMGAELMIETLRGLQAGTVHPIPQDDERATLAPVLKKEDGRMDFRRPAIEIWNRLRGFQPWPGAFTSFRGKNLHVWSARPVEGEISPATIRMEGHLPLVGCAEHSALELIEVQVEGKKRMSASDFVNGYRPYDGEVLGEAVVGR
jgi:methionyl-tRNA formyltransferase